MRHRSRRVAMTQTTRVRRAPNPMTQTTRVPGTPNPDTTVAVTTTAAAALNPAAAGRAIADTPPHRGRGMYRPVVSVAISVALGYVLAPEGTAANTQAPTVALLALVLPRLGACVPCARATSAASWSRCPSGFPRRHNRRHQDCDQRDQPASAHEPMQAWPGLRLPKRAGRLSGRQYPPPAAGGQYLKLLP